MSARLSRKLRQLDDFLLSDAVGDDAMLLSALDGFLAGVAVCPGLILPSEWLPVIWGDEVPEFADRDQAQTVLDLITGHYTEILRDLDRDRYSPVFEIDTDDSVLWEIWIEGFWRSIVLDPERWRSIPAGDADSDVNHALFCLTRLHDLPTEPTTVEPLEIDAKLQKLAASLIPQAVTILHWARLATAGPAAGPPKTAKTGRNAPCPCGSGKKFKHCCAN
jgi:uncharacterized protein